MRKHFPWLLGLLLLARPAASETATSLWRIQPYRLRVNRQPTPCFTDDPNPTFRWSLAVDPASSDTEQELPKGVNQATYQLRIHQLGGPPGDAVYDSGVQSSATPWHRATGDSLGLRGDRKYSWSVEVCSGTAEIACGTAAGEFTFVTLGDSAAWIGGFPQYRVKFDLPASETVSQATLKITALGAYAAYINGQRVAPTEILAPGFSTVYTARVLYGAYDVAGLLRNGGRNVIGARIGRSKYGYIGAYCDQGEAKCNALLVELVCQFASGHTMTVVSSANGTSAWQGTASSPITYQHLYHGETFDARLDDPTWATPQGSDADWVTALAANPIVGDLQLIDMPPIRVTEERTPTVTQPVSGVYVFDMGVTMSGVPRLAIPPNCPTGTTITLYHAEVVFPNGTVDQQFDGNCNDATVNCARQLDTYTCSGQEGGANATRWEPLFTYHGFRYVQAKGFPAGYQPTPQTVTGLFAHTDNPLATDIRFGRDGELDPTKRTTARVMQTLHDATIRTEWSNAWSVPTDCPQREKRGWMADGQLYSDHSMLTFDNSAFYANWLRSMRDLQLVGCQVQGQPWNNSRRPNSYLCCGSSGDYKKFGCSGEVWTDVAGSLADVVPLGNIGAWPGDPQWESAAVIISYNLFKYHDDLAAVEASWPLLTDFMGFLQRHTDPQDGLVHFGELGDWVSLEPTSRQLVASFYYAQDLRMMAEMAAAIGRTADADRYAALFAAAVKAFDATYYNAAAKAFGNPPSQTSQILALTLGPTLPHYGEAAAALASKLGSPGQTLTTGSAGTRYVLQAMQSVGLHQAALNLTVRVAEPSWGYWVSQGPGTLWETWPGSSNSHSHPFLGGGVGLFLLSQVAGIERMPHGRLSLRPHAEALMAVGRVASVSEHARGAVSVAWELGESGSTLVAEVVLPPGLEADLCIPRTLAIEGELWELGLTGRNKQSPSIAEPRKAAVTKTEQCTSARLTQGHRRFCYGPHTACQKA